MPARIPRPMHKLALFGGSVVAYAIMYYTLVGYDNFYFRRDSNSNYPTSEWEKFFHLLFFSAVTQSTVGYGDTYPRTIMGKILVMTQIFVPFITLLT